MEDGDIIVKWAKGSDQDLRKSKRSNERAIRQKIKEQILPVSFARWFAQTKFLFPRQMWKRPVYPISRKPEVWSSCQRTILDMLAIISCKLSIFSFVYFSSDCSLTFWTQRIPASRYKLSSVKEEEVEGRVGGLYLVFSDYLSMAMVLGQGRGYSSIFFFLFRLNIWNSLKAVYIFLQD